MTLEELKSKNCKHENMLTVRKERIHVNNQYRWKEILICPDYGYTEEKEDAGKYPKKFRGGKVNPGGKEFYR